MTWTGTCRRLELVQGVADREPTASGTGTVTEQGVLQPGPIEVRASAPGGFDSS